MNLMELAIKVGVDDDTQSGMDSISSSVIARGVAIGNAMWDVTKQVASAAVGAAKGLASGVVEAYGSYEQLVGGVDKLYGDASGRLQQYAQEAYRTAGLSANQYMEQATSFSSALIKSLGGDTQAAADLTDVAMRSMADNVDTFGSNMEDVQNAFQGFAKQNYTMLDNLKLGYGGTQSEMKRLVKDASQMTDVQKQLGLTVDSSSLSFDNIVKAIQVMQTSMGIAGTTSKEAMSTIEGSVRMLQTSWENFLTYLGTGDPELIAGSVTGMVDAIFGAFDSEVGARQGGIIQNVLPVLQNAGAALVAEVPSIAATLLAEAQSALDGVMASLGIDTGPIKDKLSQVGQLFQDTFGQIDTSSVQELLDGLAGAGQAISDTLGSVDLTGLFEGVSEGVQNFLDLVAPVGDIMAQAFSDPAVQEALQTLSDLLGVVADVALTVFGAAIQSVVAFLAGLLVTVSEAINWLSDFAGIFVSLFSGDLQGAVDQFVAMFGGIPGAIAGFLQEVIVGIITWVAQMAESAAQAGSQFLMGVVGFLSQVPGQVAAFLAGALATVLGWVASLAASAVQAGTSFLTGIVTFFSQVPGQISGLLSQALSTLAAFVGRVATNAAQAGSRFLSGIRTGFNGAVSFVRGIPGQIVGALGNVGSLLFNAGSSIMNGLRDGIISGFQSVINRVRSMASEIAAAKGPLDYDRVVLVPNGVTLMEGLLAGVSRGFEGSVLPYVSSMAGRMAEAVRGSGWAPDEDKGTGRDGAASRGGDATAAAITAWLSRNLGDIIARYAPTATPREFGRMVRGYA